jgi:hypothetical protein
MIVLFGLICGGRYRKVEKMQKHSFKAAKRKTKRELEVIVLERLSSLRIARLEVEPDAIWGWHAIVSASEELTEDYQDRVDKIVNELRNSFELEP